LAGPDVGGAQGDLAAGGVGVSVGVEVGAGFGQQGVEVAEGDAAQDGLGVVVGGVWGGGRRRWVGACLGRGGGLGAWCGVVCCCGGCAFGDAAAAGVRLVVDGADGW
jgi:hypothetical protein